MFYRLAMAGFPTLGHERARLGVTLKRRAVLGALGLLPILTRTQPLHAQALPPVRTVTKGPSFHWFGYYDKWQFDPTDRFLLSNEVAFEGRQPTADESIKVGMVDLEDNDRWIELGETFAWSWQQGCMLQWLPGSKSEVIFNAREGDHYVAKIVDTRSKTTVTLDGPVYAVSPDATSALAPDFRRLQDLRPGYGYAGIADPNAAVGAPTDAGIWRVDLTTGKQQLLKSLAEIAEIAHVDPWPAQAHHWVNHLLFAPDGKRVVFLHRWSAPSFAGFKTRMITMAADGTDAYVLNPPDMTSHFIWRDSEHILGWSKNAGQNHFHLFQDKTAQVEIVGGSVLTQDGHCTYLPRHKNEWVLNDTYPDGQRLQHDHLFHIPTGKVIPIGNFLSPAAYTGPVRCDTHPRFSRDGTKVAIDSPHSGGRQLRLIDISEIVGPAEPLPAAGAAGAAGVAGAGGVPGAAGQASGGAGGPVGGAASNGTGGAVQGAAGGAGSATSGASDLNGGNARGQAANDATSGCGCALPGLRRQALAPYALAGAAAVAALLRRRET